MRKRGQLLGTPIMYILIVIVMALVLFFGFKTVGDVFHARDITQTSKFVLDFQDDVEVVYSYDVGSAKSFKSIALPSKVTHVCFFDPTRSITMNNNELNALDYSLFYYLDVSMTDNLFLVPVNEYGSPYPDYYIEHFKSNSEENPLCVEKTKNGVEVILESYLEERQVYVGVKRVE